MCLNSYTHRVSALNEKFLIVFGKRELKQASQLKPNFLTMFRCWTLFLFNTFLAAYRGMWDVSSLTRDWTSAPCIGSVFSTTGPPGEVPRGTLLSNKLGFILLLFWRRKWQLTPISLAGEFQGQRSLVSYSPWRRRVGHNWGTCFLLSLLWKKHVKPNYEVGLISNTMREPPLSPWGKCSFWKGPLYPFSLWPQYSGHAQICVGLH